MNEYEKSLHRELETLKVFNEKRRAELDAMAHKSLTRFEEAKTIAHSLYKNPEVDPDLTVSVMKAMVLDEIAGSVARIADRFDNLFESYKDAMRALEDPPKKAEDVARGRPPGEIKTWAPGTRVRLLHRCGWPAGTELIVVDAKPTSAHEIPVRDGDGDVGWIYSWNLESAE